MVPCRAPEVVELHNANQCLTGSTGTPVCSSRSRVRKPGCAASRRTATPTMELKSISKHGRNYLIMPDGVAIPYKVFGENNDGPACVLTPGGKQGIALESKKAKELAKQGFRAIVHDRRNTGAADIGFGDGSKTELELQVEDTIRLIEHLNMSPCVFIGESSGGRMSLLCALKEPSAVQALCLRNMTGGELAGNVLSEAYHYQFLGPLSRESMAGVIQTQHFQEMIRLNPDCRKQLEEVDPGVFRSVQQASGDFLRTTGHLPVIGLTEEELRSLSGVPAKIFWSHFHFDDGMHTRAVMETLANLLQAGEVIIPKTEEVLVSEITAFMRSLPPLDERRGIRRFWPW
mmetsp:Transcript_19816/g.43334  ORF Transcript_19816/g.43334 Transcript_19816/m.43334 type:complete len:345 (-) Transcript_19816:203-1237(-)